MSAHFARRALLVLLPALTLLAGPREGAIPRDGFILHYRASGTGIPLVLLSGGPGLDVDYLEPVAGKLREWNKGKVVLLEQRGTGRSLLPAVTSTTMNLDLAVEDLEALRTDLGGRPLTLVGHSWGGILALAYAARYPKQTAALVLIDSGGMDMGFNQAFRDNINARMTPQQRAASARAMQALMEGKDPCGHLLELVRADSATYFYDRKMGQTFAEGIRPESFHCEVAMVLGQSLGGLNLRDRLTNFSNPVLILQGHQDPMPESVACDNHHVLKGSKLVFLDKAGHFPWLEQPEATFRAITDFLDTVVKQPRKR